METVAFVIVVYTSNCLLLYVSKDMDGEILGLYKL